MKRQNLFLQNWAGVKAKRPIVLPFLLLICFVHLENQFTAIKGLGFIYFTIYTHFLM